MRCKTIAVSQRSFSERCLIWRFIVTNELRRFLRNDKMTRSSAFIRSFCRSSIESKRQKPQAESDGELDILTVAMASGAFSDEELVDQMMTFLAAGAFPLSLLD